jgi:hypothetical protein
MSEAYVFDLRVLVDLSLQVFEDAGLHHYVLDRHDSANSIGFSGGKSVGDLTMG